MIAIALLAALAALIIYKIITQKQSLQYWKRRGVPQLNPHFIFGDRKDSLQQKIKDSVENANLYRQAKKLGYKHIGVYRLTHPQWFLVDPEIIKQIVVKDFTHFSAHNPKFSDKLLFNNIFHFDGDKWKDMRRKLTPTFTSGKMKMMFDLILEKTRGLSQLVNRHAGESLEMKEALARFTTDIIGSCAFGIECDSLKEKDSEFYRNGQDVLIRINSQLTADFLKTLRFILGMPIKIDFDLDDVENFYRQVVNETIKYREQNKVVRNDFLHLMIQLKNSGSIKDILNQTDVFKKSGETGLTMEEIAGQCMLFFSAGFETSSTTMSFALLEISHNQDVQKKMRQEVREVLKRYNGTLSYEALQELPYIENVIQETLRKYPPVPDLSRMCTKTYKLPGSDVVIEKGTNVVIPIFAIHNDPDYFPNPEKFDPERFNAENKKNIVDCTYMPFGEGPRQCLGLRFGMMQSKAGLATLVDQFEFTLSKQTTYPPKIHPTWPVLSADGGIWLNVQKV